MAARQKRTWRTIRPGDKIDLSIFEPAPQTAPAPDPEESIPVAEWRLEKDFSDIRSIINNSDNKCFITDFQESEITYFYKALNENPCFRDPEADRANLDHLRRILKIWEKLFCNNSEKSPLEPFLYALKLSDGIVGSLSTSQIPRDDQLESFADALIPYWKYHTDAGRKIFRHMMVNWNWYQPLAVLIKMYELCPEFSDPEIDEILRELRLPSPNYAHIVIDCLTEHPTKENQEHLLKFFSRSIHSDELSNGMIQIDLRMQHAFKFMLQRYPRETAGMKSLYQQTYRSRYDKTARGYMDKIFNLKSKEDQIRDLFQQYYATNSEQERGIILHSLSKDWNPHETKNHWLFRSVKDKGMLDLAAKGIQDISGFAYGSAVFNLSLSPYVGSKEHVRKIFSNVKENDENWLSCACASYNLDQKPSLEQLARAYFLPQSRKPGFSGKAQIQWLTKDPDPNDKDYQKKLLRGKEFKKVVEMLVDELKSQPDKWQVFFSACSALYDRQDYKATYPVKIDQLLEASIPYAAKGNTILITYTINLISIIMNHENRERYRPMLMKIYDNAAFASSVHNDAERLLRNYFGGLT